MKTNHTSDASVTELWKTVNLKSRLDNIQRANKRCSNHSCSEKNQKRNFFGLNPSKRNQDAKNWRLIRRTSGGASTSIAEEASCIRGMGFGGRHWRNSIAAKKKKKKRSGFWRILGFPLSRGRSKETRFAWQEEDQEEGNDDDDDDVMTLCYMVRDLFRI